MKITDQFYSDINDGEVQNRISKLGKNAITEDQNDLALIKEFLEWKRISKH